MNPVADDADDLILPRPLRGLGAVWRAAHDDFGPAELPANVGALETATHPVIKAAILGEAGNRSDSSQPSVQSSTSVVASAPAPLPEVSPAQSLPSQLSSSPAASEPTVSALPKPGPTLQQMLIDGVKMQNLTPEQLAANDEFAIKMVKDAGWSTPNRRALWSARYANSLALEREFVSEEGYVCYMEARVAGRAKIVGQAY